MRARRGRLVEVERLRIEAARERLDVVGGEGVAAELDAVADRDVVEELHAGPRRAASISDVVSVITARRALNSSNSKLHEAHVGPALGGARVEHGGAQRELVARPHRLEPLHLVDAGRAHRGSDRPTKASAIIRIRMQQVCQPEAASPPSMVCARGLLVEMHRLRIELRREGDHLLAREAARPMLEHAARREILESEFSHCGGTDRDFLR